MTDSGSEGVTRLTPLVLQGAAGRIEALLQESDAHDHAITAVVCHPHPLYGGTMHNKVVHRVTSALFGMGVAVLRFNFRGAGASEGAHDHGNGERDDARVALEFLRGRYPSARRWIAGFSFGSWVASRLAASETDTEQLLLIAPPVHTQTFEEMHTSGVSKLVVQGTADDICRPENLARAFPLWAEPKRLIEVPGGTHFFDKQLSELSDAVLDGLRDASSNP
ncbi:MAG: alpha/beta family hydrolase [Candidatus Eisenbacteria bacterium]